MVAAAPPLATTRHTSIRTDTDSLGASDVLLLAAYAGGVIATVTLATGAVILLARVTDGLGGFVLGPPVGSPP